MKKSLSLLAWIAVASVVLYAAAAPGRGVVFHGPLACLSVALIGLGLCVDAKRRSAAAVPVDARRPRGD